MRIVTVLRSRDVSGSPGEFKPIHVQALQKQCAKWAPLASFECLTDVDVPGVDCRPLKRGWRGWWSKMELYAPEMKGDFLFMDLDTVINGDMIDILAVNKLTLLRDFFRDGKKLRGGLGSGLMFLPERDRGEIWDHFNENPGGVMALHRRGDQFLLEKFWLNRAARWQDVVPGQIVSWKVHCAAKNAVPLNARIVAFHGQPRPWAVPQLQHLYR